MTLHDKRLKQAARLQENANALSNQAMALSQLAEDLLADIEDPDMDHRWLGQRLDFENEMLLAASAERMYRDRAARRSFFPQELFAEPAWDVLLDLFAKEVRGQRVPIGKAIAASHAPHATALRHINSLVDAEMIERRGNDDDQRVALLSLTKEARRSMRAYLRSKAAVAAAS
ncbi:hypothetical protein [Aurantiacibacter gangjinensis]|uniref:hypothetical protein n=1 Tax=Aurantiacibacter gangjinensis TaxID=502682 RepID=UPI0012E0B845|nr:hypothetical protein [Aurantiacibacter gangjinensis]